MSTQSASSLREMKCVACKADSPKATLDEIASWKPQVPEWEIVEEDGEKKLRRTFKFKNYTEALAFVNRIGAMAEAEDHHPLISFTWGRATVDWWTHKIGGLHRNDFIMAAKTDEAFSQA
jgi:4a-hydroxytetrahydrobiopterin dehydratase